MMERVCLAPGKRIRPLITLMAYRAAGGRREDRIMVPALAFELFHNYTLVHDDIYDEDSTRRHVLSYHAAAALQFHSRNPNKQGPTRLYRTQASRFGAVAGFLAGLELHNLGAMAIAESDIPPAQRSAGLDIYINTSIADNACQQMDLSFEEERTISEQEYLTLAELKSGTLLAASAEWGVILAGGAPRLGKALGAYVSDLGKAFQIKDDLLDIDARGGKGRPLGSDIRTGKKTLLFIHAFRVARGADRKLLHSIVGKSSATERDTRRVIELFVRTGSVQYAEEVAERIVRGAERRLAVLRPRLTVSGYAFFESLPELLWERSR